MFIVRKVTKFGSYAIMVVILIQLTGIAMCLAKGSGQPMPGYPQYIARLFTGAARVQRGNHLEVPYEWLSVQILYVMGLCAMVSMDLRGNGGLMKICRRNRLQWWNGKVQSFFLYSVEFFLVLYGLIGLFVLVLGGKGITHSKIWMQDYGNHSVFWNAFFCQILMEVVICLVMGLFQLVLELYTRSPFSVLFSLSLVLFSVFPDICRYSMFQLTMFQWNYVRLCRMEESGRLLYGVFIPGCVAGALVFLLYCVGRKKGSKIEFY